MANLIGAGDMDQPTDHSATRNGPTPQYCTHCQQLTDDPVVVSEVHSESAAGCNIYACRAHAGLFPPAIDPLTMLRVLPRKAHGS